MSPYPAIAEVAHVFPQQASAALISSLWEGILLVVGTGLFLHILPQTTARLRFIVWTAVFLLLTVLPLLNIGLASYTSRAGASAAAPLRLDPLWSYALSALWLAAIAIRSVGFAVHAAKLLKLWNSAVPVDTWALGDLRLDLGKVKLCTSTQLDRPSVIGFFAPRILVPAWLFDQLTPIELRQIVLHELEHLRRRDDWLNLLQKLSLVVFPLNPALIWLDRRLSTERELACDDGVLEQTRAPRAYATVLTSLAERRLAYRSESRLTALALGVVGAFRRSEFSRRIESILDRRPSLTPLASRTFLAVTVTGLIGFAAATTRAPRLISFAGTPVKHETAHILAAQPVLTESAHGTPEAHFVNAAFHPGRKVASPVPQIEAKSSHAPAVKRSPRKLAPETPPPMAAPQTAAVQQSEKHWMVLTTWHEAAPTPVILTLPDGSTVLATYPAMPTQVDWLLVQL